MRPLESRVFTEFYCPVAAGYRDGSGVLPYDRAVSRALESHYKPPRDVVASPDRTLFVGRLSEQIEEENLIKVFSRFGEVEDVRVVRDIVTGCSRGYGFLVFSSPREAERAWADGHAHNLLGADIIIEREFGRNMKNWIPRRLGGGLGGRKESGQLRFGGCARPFVSAPDCLRRDAARARRSLSPLRLPSGTSADHLSDNRRNLASSDSRLEHETVCDTKYYRRRVRDETDRGWRSVISERARSRDDAGRQETSKGYQQRYRNSHHYDKQKDRYRQRDRDHKEKNRCRSPEDTAPDSDERGKWRDRNDGSSDSAESVLPHLHKKKKKKISHRKLSHKKKKKRSK